MSQTLLCLFQYSFFIFCLQGAAFILDAFWALSHSKEGLSDFILSNNVCIVLFLVYLTDVCCRWSHSQSRWELRTSPHLHHRIMWNASQNHLDWPSVFMNTQLISNKQKKFDPTLHQPDNNQQEVDSLYGFDGSSTNGRFQWIILAAKHWTSDWHKSKIFSAGGSWTPGQCCWHQDRQKSLCIALWIFSCTDYTLFFDDLLEEFAITLQPQSTSSSDWTFFFFFKCRWKWNGMKTAAFLNFLNADILMW